MTTASIHDATGYHVTHHDNAESAARVITAHIRGLNGHPTFDTPEAMSGTIMVGDVRVGVWSIT